MVTGVAIPHAKHGGPLAASTPKARPPPPTRILIHLSTPRLAPASRPLPSPSHRPRALTALLPRTARHAGGSYGGHALRHTRQKEGDVTPSDPGPLAGAHNPLLRSQRPTGATRPPGRRRESETPRARATDSHPEPPPRAEHSEEVRGAAPALAPSPPAHAVPPLAPAPAPWLAWPLRRCAAGLAPDLPPGAASPARSARPGPELGGPGLGWGSAPRPVAPAPRGAGPQDAARGRWGPPGVPPASARSARASRGPDDRPGFSRM